jgi:hypothetical protein
MALKEAIAWGLRDGQEYAAQMGYTPCRSPWSRRPWRSWTG